MTAHRLQSKFLFLHAHKVVQVIFIENYKLVTQPSVRNPSDDGDKVKMESVISGQPHHLIEPV